VGDIMTKDVVSVHPGTSLVDATNLLVQHGFNGMPVVDDLKKLVGIITEYDLIMNKGPLFQVSTFQLLVQILPLLRKDGRRYKKIIDEIALLVVAEVMNPDPFTLFEDATYEDALIAFRDHHRINPIPVVNHEGFLRGVISRQDILKPLSSVKDFSGL